LTSLSAFHDPERDAHRTSAEHDRRLPLLHVVARNAALLEQQQDSDQDSDPHRPPTTRFHAGSFPTARVYRRIHDDAAFFRDQTGRRSHAKMAAVCRRTPRHEGYIAGVKSAALVLTVLAGCAFRTGDRAYLRVPAHERLRVAVDPASTAADWARSAIAANPKLELVQVDGDPIGCFAASVTGVDVVLRVDRSAIAHPGRTVYEPKQCSFADQINKSGGSRCTQAVTPDYLAEGVVEVRAFSPGSCREQDIGRPRASKTSHFVNATEADAVARAHELVATLEPDVPRLIDQALGRVGTVVAATGDEGTLDGGHADGFHRGQLIALADDGGTRRGLAAIASDEDRATVVALGGDAPAVGMVAAPYTSNREIELGLPFVAMPTRSHVGFGLSVEQYRPLRSVLLGAEVDVLAGTSGQPTIETTRAFAGYLVEPYPRYVGLYGKLGAGGAFGGATTSPLGTVSIGAKLHATPVIGELELGYAFARSGEPAYAGPFVRVGVALDGR
jgi:hypothetical protein